MKKAHDMWKLVLQKMKALYFSEVALLTVKYTAFNESIQYLWNDYADFKEKSTQNNIWGFAHRIWIVTQKDSVLRI